MLLALVVGIFVAATATLAVAGFNRAPTRSRCPECDGATKILLLPPVLRRNEFVHMRWCPACQWEGLGRNGPDWVPGKQLAHDSGFHWAGEHWFPSDFGFKFGEPEVSDQLPPHHPSGFRFIEAPDRGRSAPHHPSGFRFVETPDLESTTPQDPSGFRFAQGSGKPALGPPVFKWAEERRGPGFRFKDDDTPPKKKTGGFDWKGVA